MDSLFVHHFGTILNVLLLHALKRHFTVFSFCWLSRVWHVSLTPLVHTISFHTLYTKNHPHVWPGNGRHPSSSCMCAADCCQVLSAAGCVCATSQCEAASLQSYTHRWLAAKKKGFEPCSEPPQGSISSFKQCARCTCVYACVCLCVLYHSVWTAECTSPHEWTVSVC